MTELEPFVAYASLLDTQLALYDGLRIARPEVVPGIRADIAAVSRDVDALLVQPGLAESALRCSVAWAYEVGVLQKDEHATTPADAEARDMYARRLRQAAAFVTSRAAERPELADDCRWQDIQDALGSLAADTTVTDMPPDEPRLEQPRQVDCAAALAALRENLAALQDGEHYVLSPAQVMTFAGPVMQWSRWQRHRFLKLAMQTLSTEGYAFAHNGGRGRSSRYLVGAISSPA